jgi:prepilin-type N-terminal cleavage/methylation domain-containing protein
MLGRTGWARGFTLIETLIAMALLAFIVADVGMVAVYASRGGTEARDITGAVSLAENAIEHAQSADFNRIRMADSPQALCFTATRAAIACGDPSARIVQECFSAALDQVACGGAGALFTRERDVTSSYVTTIGDVLSAQIVVLVTWVDARGGLQEYRLASLISKF